MAKPRRASQAQLKAAAIAGGIVAALAIFFVAEKIAYRTVLSRPRTQQMKFDGQKFFVEDANLGYWNAPNVAVRSQRLVDGKPLYDVTYTTDEYGRRVVPGQSSSARRDKFVAFFGCSFTFGEGVGDDQTMPYFFSRSVPSRHIYNYGGIGYGPQQTLAQLESGKLPSQITEKSGVGIYTYIDDHAERAAGSMRVINTWLGTLPYYELEEGDRLVRHGNFREGRRLTNFLYTLLWHLPFREYFNVNFPRVGPRELHRAARILDAARLRFRDEFHSDGFYVLIYPGTDQHPELVDELRGLGLRVIDFSRLFHRPDPRYIQSDGHPNSSAHELVARELVGWLRQNGGFRD